MVYYTYSNSVLRSKCVFAFLFVFFFFVLQINIDFQTKNTIAQNIQEATHTCFSAAQKRVYSLMENNSYPRFLESEFYQELCKKTPITRAAQGTWAMENSEEKPLGWWGSQPQLPAASWPGRLRYRALSLFAMVQGQILTLESWWRGSAAVGGHSEVTAGACQPAASDVPPCKCCGGRWLHDLDQTAWCTSPSVTAEVAVQQVKQSSLPANRSCSMQLRGAGNLSLLAYFFFS